MAALTLLMIAAAGTVALALYVKMTPANRVLPSGPEMSVKGMPAEPSTPLVHVQIPVVQYETDKLGFDRRDFTVEIGGDPKVEAVNEYLRSSKVAPEGSQLMSIDLEDSIANLHFSEGFDSGGGSMDEAALIYGIRAVLGQFDEIQQFRIFVEGKQIEALGHFEFGDLISTIPLSRWNDPASEPGETTGETPPPSMPR
jgi:hypothetical protein